MTESLVVWAFGLTMETFLDKRAFKRVLFPAFGLPRIAMTPTFIGPPP